MQDDSQSYSVTARSAEGDMSRTCEKVVHDRQQQTVDTLIAVARTCATGTATVVSHQEDRL